MEPNTDLGTKPKTLAELLENRIQPVTVKTKKVATGEAARRKLVIKDIEQLIGWDDKDGKYPLYKRFLFPLPVIPTKWLEGWKDVLIITNGGKWEKKQKLFQLLEEARKQ